MRRPLTQCLVIAVAILAANISANLHAQAPSTLTKPPQSRQDKPETNKNTESFELVWKTIKDTHWEPDKVGASWDNARRDLYPRIENAKSTEEARQVIGDLIKRLGQSHFGIIPSDSYSAIEGDVPSGKSDVGLTVRLVANQLMVTAVRDGSSASAAGVKPGWAITKIRNKDAQTLISKIKKVDNGPQRADTTIGLVMSVSYTHLTLPTIYSV